MGSNSPSARKHRALRFLSHLMQYEKYGPLVGPKEAHQPDFGRYDQPPLPETRRWPGDDD